MFGTDRVYLEKNAGDKSFSEMVIKIPRGHVLVESLLSSGKTSSVCLLEMAICHGLHIN